MLQTTSWQGKLKFFPSTVWATTQDWWPEPSERRRFHLRKRMIMWCLGVVDIQLLIGDDAERYIGNTHAVPWPVGGARVVGDVGFDKSRPRLLPTPLAGLRSAGAARPLWFPGGYVLCIQRGGSVRIAIRSLISYNILSQGPGRAFHVKKPHKSHGDPALEGANLSRAINLTAVPNRSSPWA